MVAPTRRRKGDKEILPTTAKNASMYSNSKRRRRRQLKKLLPFLVAITLFLVAALAIASLVRTTVNSSAAPSRRWAMSSNHQRTGCNNVNIHAVVHQEPNPPAICINDPLLMPKSWRAPEDVLFQDPGGPWTAEEQALADEAVDEGLHELISFFEKASHKRIRGLGTDAVNSVFDYVISSQSMPKFHQRAVDIAVKVLKVSVEEYIQEGVDVECDNMYAKTTFSGYAHRLAIEAPKDMQLKEIRDALIDHLNKSIKECETLDSMFSDGVDEGDAWRDKMADKDLESDEVYEWNMWAVALTNCLTIPELKLPEDTQEFIARVWQYAASYELPYYADYEEEEDPRGSFKDLAYLATHLQFIATGYGRHYCYVKEAPYLYHYYRENFYAAMNVGGHDLIAEFIDNLMTYGCTAENDIHVRHGVRYMLHLYKSANHTFVNHLEEWEESKKDLSDYDLIHKPWTGIASLETNGCFEPEVPGSYGHAFRKALASVDLNID
ncbi:hypothetical protein ACA910_022033 [Epithemia clementina (nom. ined.)]